MATENLDPTFDTHLDESNPTTNYKTITTIITGYQPKSTSDYNFLIAFDLSSKLNITGAILNLYITSSSIFATSGGFYISRCNASGVTEDATWNTKNGSDAWSSVGGDFITDDQLTVSTLPIADQYNEYDVTAMAQAVEGGTLILLARQNNLDQRLLYASSDGVDNDPYLAVTTADGGVVKGGIPGNVINGLLLPLSVRKRRA
jgi:hypothetical protein